MQLLPLYNYANHQIGVVALGTSFAEDKTLARRAAVWQVLSGIFALVLLSGAVILVIRGMLLTPLAALNERMVALAGGDATKPADPLEDYCDELRSTATAYEAIRQRRNS